jgi:hypothetical protein
MSTINSKTLEIGYWFFPPESKQAPGGNRLEVILSETPIWGNSSPKSIHVTVKSRQGTAEKLKVTHPWRFRYSHELLTGLIEIHTIDGSKVEAFTLGGSLEIYTNDALTTCIIKSPAPIVEITMNGTIHDLFIDELEIILAKHRAAHLYDPPEDDTGVITASPLELYAAILNDMLESFDHSHHKEDTQVQELINFLHAEVRRLQVESQLPQFIHPLEELI